jgi:hypothetical protein
VGEEVGSLKEAVRAETERVERELIQRALDETAGNVTQAARKLQISRKSLQTKMKELGLRDKEQGRSILSLLRLCYRGGRTVIGTRTPIALLASLWLLVPAPAADAAEVTRVLTARSLKDFDVHVSVDYQHDQSKASIKREYVQTTGTVVVNDAIYRQTRDSMQLRAEAGLFHDLSFALAGSFVLGDQRGLDFDRSGDCAAGPASKPCSATASCPAPRARAGASTPKTAAGPSSRPRARSFRGPTAVVLNTSALACAGRP